MRWQGKNNDEDISEAQNNVDLAYEDAYRIARKVRECPDCDCGWEEVGQYQPHTNRHATVMRACRSCNWQRPWAEAMGRVKAAKRAYRRMTDCEPPDPIRQAPMGDGDSLAFYSYPTEPTEDEKDRGAIELIKLRARIAGLAKGMDLNENLDPPPPPQEPQPPDEDINAVLVEEGELLF